MENGFLGNNASLMLDVVVCALVLIVPALLFSLYTVKFRRNYALHKTMQLTLGIVLLITVLAFEIDMQLYHGGWENIVNKPDEPVRLDGVDLESVRTLLWIHLVFAISTPILWATTITLALKRFPNPPVPSEHSALHKKLGWISAIDITLTSITGLIFYYSAFIV
jgi:hypothetical protein